MGSPQEDAFPCARHSVPAHARVWDAAATLPAQCPRRRRNARCATAAWWVGAECDTEVTDQPEMPSQPRQRSRKSYRKRRILGITDLRLKKEKLKSPSTCPGCPWKVTITHVILSRNSDLPPIFPKNINSFFKIYEIIAWYGFHKT